MTRHLLYLLLGLALPVLAIVWGCLAMSATWSRREEEAA